MAVISATKTGAPPQRRLEVIRTDPPPVRPWDRRYVTTLAGLDGAAGFAAAVTAYATGFGIVTEGGGDVAPLALACAFAVLWVATLSAAQAYTQRSLAAPTSEFACVLSAAVWLTAGLATGSLLVSADPGPFLLCALPVVSILTLVSRRSARMWLHRMRARGRCSRQVLVVGHAAPVAGLVRELRRGTAHGMRVVGACVGPGDGRQSVPRQRMTGDDLLDVPVLGGFDDVIAAATASGADTVAVLGCPELDGPSLRRLGWDLEPTCTDLIVVPAVLEAAPRIALTPVAGLAFLHVRRPEFAGPRRVVKEVADRVIAAVALLLLMPAFLAIAGLIKVTSPGAVLFRQVRVGRDGREFTLLKFRTMFDGAETLLPDLRPANINSDGVLFKVRHDPRVTPLGRRLRRFSLDELPQIFNVLAGHMSLVGPRPHLSEEVARYAPDVRRRLLVKPGVTGLWQVGGRSELSWEESVRLDLQYVDNWSLGLDLKIIGKTLGAIARGSGAY